MPRRMTFSRYDNWANVNEVIEARTRAWFRYIDKNPLEVGDVVRVATCVSPRAYEIVHDPEVKIGVVVCLNDKRTCKVQTIDGTVSWWTRSSLTRVK